MQFSTVPLEEGSSQPQIKKKVPRRILHFSDGILEEYSTDEEEEKEPETPPVDPVRTIPVGRFCKFLLVN